MSLPDQSLLRSYLYVPGDRPEVFRKAVRSGADAVIFDLEDAVHESGKDRARGYVRDTLAEVPLDAVARHVRIRTGVDAVADLAAVAGPALSAVRMPKVSDPGLVAEVSDWLDANEVSRGIAAGAVGLYLTVESAFGLVQLSTLIAASGRVRQIAFGEADFMADLGLPDTDPEAATAAFRSHLVLTSRLHRLAPPVDSVWTDVADVRRLEQRAVRARAMGFFGKAVIHPLQVEVVNRVFTPTPAEVAEATSVVEAYVSAAREGRAATVAGNRFVDPAVVARARAVLRLVNRGAGD